MKSKETLIMLKVTTFLPEAPDCESGVLFICRLPGPLYKTSKQFWIWEVLGNQGRRALWKPNAPKNVFKKREQSPLSGWSLPRQQLPTCPKCLGWLCLELRKSHLLYDERHRNRPMTKSPKKDLRSAWGQKIRHPPLQSFLHQTKSPDKDIIQIFFQKKRHLKQRLR